MPDWARMLTRDNLACKGILDWHLQIESEFTTPISTHLGAKTDRQHSPLGTWAGHSCPSFFCPLRIDHRGTYRSDELSFFSEPRIEHG